ncbi:MAG: MlaD family protein [Burkholderiales bacterium]
MKQKATPALIGAFVLGAIALAALALILFTPLLTAEKATRVLFNFDSGVTGLQIGAPVTFRGVRMGEVTSIRVVYDPARKVFLFPVEARLTNQIQLGGEAQRELTDDEVAALKKRLVEGEGLRARMELISFVTGQQRIQIDFIPDAPLELHGAPPGWWEIPTLPSKTEQLENALRELPLEEIVIEVRDVLANLNSVLGPSGAKDAKNLRDVLAAATAALRELERDLPRVTASIDGTATAAKQTLATGKLTLEQIRATAAAAETRVNTVAEAIDRLAASTDKTLGQTRNTLANVENLTAENAPLVYELSTALKDLGAAARSIRLLASELEKRPDGLIRGRPAEEEKR